MRTVGHIIVRLVSIFLGLALAFLAAGAFLGLGFFNHVIDPALAGEEIGGRGFFTFLLAFIWSPFIAAVALGPALLLIAIAELGRWRGFIVNMALGALAALFTFWLNDNPASGQGLAQGTLVVLLATGFVGGAGYWLIAGRKAGAWLD